MNELILSPEYEAIRKELEKLRSEFVRKMYELDELRYVICENIESEYMLELGDLEYKVYRQECEYRRLKRKLELIQRALNHNRVLDVEAIERTLSEEFEIYRIELENMMEKMNKAIERSSMRSLSKEESVELRSYYRAIMKKIHPDMNPDLSDQQLKLFFNAVEAYKNGDVKTLKLIHTMIEDENINGFIPENPDDYKKLKERLEDSIDEINAQTENIKSHFPYNVKWLLEDKEELHLKKEQMKESYDQYKESIGFLSEKVNRLIADSVKREVNSWVS